MTTPKCPAGTTAIARGLIEYTVFDFSSGRNGVPKPVSTHTEQVDKFCISPRVTWGDFRRSKIYQYMKLVDKNAVEQLNKGSADSEDVRGVPWNRAIGHCELSFGSEGSFPSEAQWHRANVVQPLVAGGRKMDLLLTNPKGASLNDALQIGKVFGNRLRWGVVDKNSVSATAVFRCVIPAK